MPGRCAFFPVSGRRLRAFWSIGLVLAALIILSAPSSSRAAAVTNKIAWMASSNLNQWVIKIMDLNGGNQQNLSQVSDPTGQYSDQDPHFKPDGTKILFSSRRAGDSKMRLQIMDPDGTNLVGLSPNGAPFEAHNGKFSWDGTRVVFVKKGDGDGLAYFQVNDPAGTMTVIPTTTSKDYWPVFSPDGQWVAFQRDQGSNLMQIFKIRLDGSNLTPLTDGFNRDEMPYFSPDGKYILFKRGDGQTVNMDIWRMNADGSGLVNLSNTPAINENGPCYSWDGAEIAYNGGGNGAYGTEIYTAHPDGSGSRTLTTDGNVNYYATFSPLAKRLAVPLGLLLDD